MILVITISLSNGGEVVYEMDRLYYSQRIQFVDDENTNQDMFTIHKFGSLLIHELIKKKDEVQYFSRQVRTPTKNLSGENGFQQSLNPFFLDEFEGLEHIYLMPQGLKTGQFYVYIKELGELYADIEIDNIAPIINEGYILAFSDVSSIEKNFLTRPISVNVEWQESFSRYVEMKIEEIIID